jgi:hypothetical protein
VADTPLACPACAAPVDDTGVIVLKCPACGEQFFREPIHDTIDAPPEPEPEVDESELAAKRIRAMALELRAVQRLAMWSRGMALACLAGSLVAMYRAIDHATRSDAKWTWYGVIAVVLMWATSRLWMRARQLKSEAHRLRPPEPLAPPRFDGLGAGADSAAQGLAELDRDRESRA